MKPDCQLVDTFSLIENCSISQKTRQTYILVSTIVRIVWNDHQILASCFLYCIYIARNTCYRRAWVCAIRVNRYAQYITLGTSRNRPRWKETYGKWKLQNTSMQYHMEIGKGSQNNLHNLLLANQYTNYRYDASNWSLWWFYILWLETA